MKNPMIPLYGSDGSSLGFRTMEAAKRLLADGKVKPAFGRKGHLKAIFEQHEDGGTPVSQRPAGGARYSYMEQLKGRRCWSLRRVDLKDEDGTNFSTRPLFMGTVESCLVRGR